MTCRKELDAGMSGYGSMGRAHSNAFRHANVSVAFEAFSLSQDQPYRPNFADGLEVRRLLDLVSDSARENSWVDVSPTAPA